MVHVLLGELCAHSHMMWRGLLFPLLNKVGARHINRRRKRQFTISFISVFSSPCFLIRTRSASALIYPHLFTPAKFMDRND